MAERKEKERKEILRTNYMMLCKSDAIDLVEGRLEHCRNDLEKFKDFFTSDESIMDYEESIEKIYNILKSQVKDFFTKYYKDKIEEFERNI